MANVGLRESRLDAKAFGLMAAPLLFTGAVLLLIRWRT
jgi:hypothetical protein